jgi:biotin transport system substrate-specific component
MRIIEEKMHNTISNEFFRRLYIKENIFLDAGLIIFGSLFIAASAQLVVFLPFSPVPITGQTFAVLLTGGLLGAKKAGLSVTLYVLEGLSGLPVFAGGTGGLAVLFGPTAGFLCGFIPAAVLVGYMAERSFDRNYASMAFTLILGQAVIYLFGVLRLLAFANFESAIQMGVYMFLIGDALKIGLAMMLLPSGWKLLAKKQSNI